MSELEEPAGEKPKQKLVQVRKRLPTGTHPEVVPPASSAPEPDDDPPPALHTPFEDVPPEENDPRQRREPTVGLIELTEEGRAHVRRPERPLDVPGAGFEVQDVSDSVLRTLEDIMAAFPVGNGQYFVNVQRQQPSSFHGISTRGILRKLKQPATLEEFRDQYGGGVYDLIVYGPPKRGGIADEVTGQLRPKALTKPIRIVIPWHLDGGHPPNLDAAYEEEEDDMTMRETYRGNGGLPYNLNPRSVTPATANVVKHQLDHDETMDERDRRDRREERQDTRKTEHTALDIVSKQAERREAELLETIRQLTARADRAEQRKPQSDLEGMAKVLQTVNPRASADEMQSLRDGHQRELDRITTAHRAEVDTLTRRHSEERDRLMQQHRGDLDRTEQRVTDVARRADDRVLDVEKRLERSLSQAKEDIDRQKRDLDQAHERELAFARNEATRSLEAQKLSYENILSSERRSAEREIQVKEQIAASQLSTEKSKLEIELRSMKQEATRREQDVLEFKKLAEKNKDLGRILEDAKRMAELVGYVPKEEGGAGEPAEVDWKQMIFHVITEGAKNLPQILQSAGAAVAQVRGGAQPAAQRPMPQGHTMPPGLPSGGTPYAPPPRRAFATEASGIEPSAPPQYFEQPNYGINTSPIQQHVPQEQQRPIDVAFQQPMIAAQEEQQVMAQPPPQPAPVAQPMIAPALATPSSPPPPSNGAPPVDTQFDAAILQAREQLLEPAFKAKENPKTVAGYIVQQLGTDRVRMVLPSFRPDAIIAAIRRAGVSSALVTRAGRRYLSEIESEVVSALGQEGKS